MNVRAFSAGEQITCLGLRKHEAQIWAQDLQTALLRAYVIREPDHGPDHVHSHSHPHQHTKQVVNRLARATGHLDKVKRMVERGDDCTEVLIQLSAVIAALNRAGKVILEDHIENCIVDAVRVGDEKAIEDLKNAIDRFVK